MNCLSQNNMHLFMDHNFFFNKKKCTILLVNDLTRLNKKN